MNTTRTPWTVTVLMALGTMFAMLALSTLIEGSSWFRTMVLVLAVVTGMNLAVRAASRSRFLPTLASLVTAVVVMIPLFAVDEAGAKHLLPTPSAIADLWRAIAEGASYAAGTPAPATATTPLVALLTGFAAAIFIVADHLAASWRAAAVSGIVLLLPWTPAIFLQYQVPMWALFATAACWMGALGIARSQLITQRSGPVTGVAVATIAALVATVLIVPAALGGNGWGAIPRINAPDSLETSTRLNLSLDLRNSLTVNSEQVVMEYTSTGQHPAALRLYTFSDFDGSMWTRPKEDPTDTIPAAGPVLWPTEVPGWDDADRVTLDMHVRRSAERNLPLPTQPRTVNVGDDWLYSPSLDEVSTTGKGTRGLDYTIVADLDFFTTEGLEASQAAIDAGTDPVSPEYNQLPSSVDSARFEDLATSLTAGATTQFEQAVAIQNYLRDTENFTYDTTVAPVDGGDSVSVFLDDRKGYCVQFATAMVMLSRSIGIPSRMAIGFLGGHLSDNNVWTVRSGDAHAWPELYFPGQGWVRFEPTPAVQTGSAPGYTLNTGTSPSNPTPTKTSVPTNVPTTPAQTTPPTTGNPTGTTPDAGVPLPLLIALVLLVACAGVAAWFFRRRSVARANAFGPEAAWASLRAQVPDALRWSTALTPTEAASGLKEAMRAADAPLSDAGTLALASLRDAVISRRYAPPRAEVDEPLEEWLTQQVKTVADEARETTRSRPARAGAQSAPRHES